MGGRDAESVLGVAGGWHAWTSGAGVMSVRSAQMMVQQKRKRKKERKKDTIEKLENEAEEREKR